MNIKKPSDSKNLRLDVAFWDSRACRVKFRGRFVNLQTFDLTKLLHYQVVSKLPTKQAQLLHARLVALPMSPCNHNVDIMVWRARVEMALNDLRKRCVIITSEVLLVNVPLVKPIGSEGES